MPYNWDQCIIEGKKSFNYMIYHFYEMFDYMIDSMMPEKYWKLK